MQKIDDTQTHIEIEGKRVKVRKITYRIVEPPVEEIPDFPIRINHRKLAEEIAALPGDDDPFCKTLNEHHP